jgi:hypothetical protein
MAAQGRRWSRGTQDGLRDALHLGLRRLFLRLNDTCLLIPAVARHVLDET